MTLTVRRLADARDGKALLRMLRSALDDASFDARLDRAVAGGYCAFVAEAAGQPIGYLGFRIVDDVCWGCTFYIDDLVVDPDQRGGGVGAALLAASEQAARERGCDAIRLCSSLVRTDAHRFYEANGFARRSYQFCKLLEV